MKNKKRWADYWNGNPQEKVDHAKQIEQIYLEQRYGWAFCNK